MVLYYQESLSRTPKKCFSGPPSSELPGMRVKNSGEGLGGVVQVEGGQWGEQINKQMGHP